MLNQKGIFLLIITFLLVGQGRGQQSDGPLTIINLTTIPGMQFDLVRFTVKPGAQVKIILTNSDDMTHNLLITKPGTRLEVVNEALKLEEKGPAMNYIPKTSNVLWSIPAVSANQSASLTFTAPIQAGAYPYVCTLPGHGFIMYGVMYVSTDNKMPDLKSDIHIPLSRREDKTAVSQISHPLQDKKEIKMLHPYEQIPPFLYRIFMEDAGPAAIAVSLPQDLSYCWDAGACRLRYAWIGDFVDNTLIWKGHTDANAKILGSVFYRDNTEYPILIGKQDQKPVLEFKGYRLLNKYPEFNYTVNGVNVFELILPRDDGKGLVRKFRIPDVKETVWFSSSSPAGSIVYEVSAGEWINGKLKLSPDQAKEFSVTMKNYSLFYNTRKKK